MNAKFVVDADGGTVLHGRTGNNGATTQSVASSSLGGTLLVDDPGNVNASVTRSFSLLATTLTANSTINQTQSGGSSLAIGLVEMTTVTGSGFNLTVNGAANNNFQITGAITTGTGTLTKNGAGLLSLGGVNTYTGLTTVNGGELRLTTTDSVFDADNEIAVATGATFNINARNATIAGLSNVSSAGGTLTNTGAARTLSIGGSGTYTFNGTITATTPANLALTKTGSGTQTLSGNNTYAGITTISAGTLLINGNQTAATGNVSVASGATLGGNGTLGGATTITGILSPGNGGIDTLNIVNNVTWQGAASAGAPTDWVFNLASSGTGADLLNITGNFTKDTALGSIFRFDFKNSAPALVGTTFKLVDWSGTTTFADSDFSVTSSSGLEGTFAFNGSQLDFTLSAIPEPSTWSSLILGLGLIGGTIVYRRRTRKA
jgi:fibronectin-binding autotransporter adhesin